MSVSGEDAWVSPRYYAKRRTSYRTEPIQNRPNDAKTLDALPVRHVGNTPHRVTNVLFPSFIARSAGKVLSRPGFLPISQHRNLIRSWFVQ